MKAEMKAELKDQRLDWLVSCGLNIAQFVSYGPDGKQRYSRIKNSHPEHSWSSVREAIKALFKEGRRPSVSIRSFLPEKPDGNPFILDIRSMDEAVEIAKRLNSDGLFIIINETMDVSDGGFSGVIFGDLMEVSPLDTPRCVDKSGTMALPIRIGIDLIKTVYGFDVNIPFSGRERVEFSVHPERVGYLSQQQITWQVDSYKSGAPNRPKITWPHNYSRTLGDKAFGLLIAHLIGLRVPHSTVIGRIVPLFSFGERTNQGEVWMRTCPNEQTPGKFPTVRGWSDPFRILQGCDPGGENIASLIIQDSIKSEYAGACVLGADKKLIIEGQRGYGDTFMVGETGAEKLPKNVIDAVTLAYSQTDYILGDVRFEWVFDGNNIWIVQLHVGATESNVNIIYPGKPRKWININISDGLENLREIILTIEPGTGVILHGNVGITSHFGDILRKAKIPSRLK